MSACQSFVTAVHGEAANVLPPLRILTTNSENVLDCDAPASTTTSRVGDFYLLVIKKGLWLPLVFTFLEAVLPVRLDQAVARNSEALWTHFIWNGGEWNCTNFGSIGKLYMVRSAGSKVVSIFPLRSGAVTRRNLIISLNRVNPIVQSIVKKKQK